MKTLAAVLVETGRPLELVDLELPLLKPGQAIVKVSHSGVCHTQILEARGYRGEDRYLPHCLGHEGSGVVVETGENVSKCQIGRRVILSWMKGSGADVPGTVYGWDRRSVNAGAITTFQQLAVVSENRLVALPDSVGDREGALLGCAVPTGFGAVWNTGQATTGQSVAIFGTGGIGLCAVAAAAARSAEPLIAVDINASRLELAKRFGATVCIDATTGDVLDRVRKICPQGVDLAIEATGRTAIMRQALSAVRNRGGTVVVVGNARHGEVLEIDPHEFNQGKRLLGTWGGDNEPDRDFPRYAELLSDNKLDLSPLVPKTYDLSQINQALDDLETGRVPRPLIKLE
jgi:S-(hydroxymethyl)glutathione dehydrogenase/alcohol dehydrogenase